MRSLLSRLLLQSFVLLSRFSPSTRKKGGRESSLALSLALPSLSRSWCSLPLPPLSSSAPLSPPAAHQQRSPRVFCKQPRVLLLTTPLCTPLSSLLLFPSSCLVLFFSLSPCPPSFLSSFLSLPFSSSLLAAQFSLSDSSLLSRSLFLLLLLLFLLAR